ncbi:phosphatidylethanolamine-binding protein [Cardiosporidium cionae]|uniref:Phosphatidylethanolamine-binding protein n=1 Tax=Cardiosporidium cionae TaxID=476202 RepID=A0ABQ7JCE2_9APIC|nr:phosphatidylethanolamine-binding protein [Cardiosporidium cionae]|eukprot:KAF8821691.1 phosphatidylethanolamine-binding protein [Cardiosporidium cionae]
MEKKVTKESLEAEGIIPDVIPGEAAFTPSVEIKVNYKSGQSVDCGNSLEVNATASIPRQIQFSSKPPENCEYVLVMTDPDAPSRKTPSMREWAHWVVAGIQSDTLNQGTCRGASTLLAYNGPSPPPNTGYHRYIFLLFLMEAGKSSEIRGLPLVGDSRVAQRRGKWNGYGTAWRFAETYSLRCVGINWFRCEVNAR